MGNRAKEEAARAGAGGLTLLRYFLPVFKKCKRGRIETVTLSGWRRTVGENMSLVSAASCAADLDSAHPVAAVFNILEMVLIERPIKRWPACTGIEFVT